MKKLLIITGILFLCIFLTFKITNYAIEISVETEGPTYSGGATIKVTSNENMKYIKLYKKTANTKFILFFVGKVKGTTFTYRIPNSQLSEDNKTEIKVVAETDGGDRGIGSTTIDKVPPRVSMNPEETAKPTTTEWVIPTKPTPTTTSQASPTSSAQSTSEPGTSEQPGSSEEPSTSEQPSPEPTTSESPQEPLSVNPGETTETYNSMRYIQIIPDNPTENMPLIVFLHGSGEIGSESGVKNLPITTYVASKKPYEAGNFIFIAPILESGAWADSGTASKVKDLIENIASQYKINKKKIILTGMSRGGHGTWYMANKYPGYFSAIVPMSGHVNVDVNNFKDTPIWAISGTAGDLEQYFRPLMTNLVNSINQASGKNLAKMEAIEGATHSTIQQYYKRLELFQWMLGQGSDSGGSGSGDPSSQGSPISAEPGLTKNKYKNMNYFQVIPDNPTDNMPLIVFLHGDGESKSFNSVGNLPITKYVSSKEAFKAGKFIFIAPHQSNYSWSNANTVSTLMELIEKVANDYKVDKNRIILTGMSRGGIGTWYIANKYPNYFAAIVPMSGYTSINVNNFVNLPIWAISGNVGSNEQKYNKNMKSLVDKINNASGKKLAKMETIKGASHSTIQQQYKRKELFEWMLSQKKN